MGGDAARDLGRGLLRHPRHTLAVPALLEVRRGHSTHVARATVRGRVGHMATVAGHHAAYRRLEAIGGRLRECLVVVVAAQARRLVHRGAHVARGRRV